MSGDALSCSGRSVLLTGAGAGLGRAMAIALAAAGAELVCAVRRAETGMEVVREIEAAGGRTSWVACDIKRKDQVEAAVRVALERCGRLDVMIHNATSPLSSEQKTLEKLDDAFWEELVSTNLRAAFWFARACHPHLTASRGTLILLTSGAGIEGASVLPEYGASKAAIRALVKSLAQEWGPDGINVNCLAPAGLTTAYQRVFDQDPKWAEHVKANVPLGRVGDPLEDIAPIVVFLASPAARYMTGQTLVATGGRTLLL
jgi:NAD(P)-dependent dehydrogenase (short-subunit alcohol dehydrogenase family)